MLWSPLFLAFGVIFSFVRSHSANQCHDTEVSWLERAPHDEKWSMASSLPLWIEDNGRGLVFTFCMLVFTCFPAFVNTLWRHFTSDIGKLQIYNYLKCWYIHLRCNCTTLCFSINRFMDNNLHWERLICACIYIDIYNTDYNWEKFIFRLPDCQAYYIYPSPRRNEHAWNTPFLWYVKLGIVSWLNQWKVPKWKKNQVIGRWEQHQCAQE